MKFYLNGKKITKKEAMTFISKEQLAEAKQAHNEDPYEEIAFWVGKGMLVIEF